MYVVVLDVLDLCLVFLPLHLLAGRSDTARESAGPTARLARSCALRVGVQFLRRWYVRCSMPVLALISKPGLNRVGIACSITFSADSGTLELESTPIKHESPRRIQLLDIRYA
jgi:hypothetical protein